MSGKGEQQDRAEEATTFFNRGRRFAADIVKDNEELRSRIRRLERTLRGETNAGHHRRKEGEDSDER